MRKGYKVATIDADLYKKALEITSAKTLSEAIRRLLPKCIEIFIRGDHLFIEAMIEEIIIENVYYIDISGLKVRMDYVMELVVRTMQEDEIKGLIYFLLLYYSLRNGSFKVLSKPEVIKVNHKGHFLVDTGSTMTVINTALLPEKVRRAAISAEKKMDVQTVTQKIRVAKGVARISLANTTIKERVLIVDAPSSDHHLMGVTTLRRLLGNKIIIDFENARICRVGSK